MVKVTQKPGVTPMILTSSHKAAIALFCMLLPSLASAFDYATNKNAIQHYATIDSDIPLTKTVYLSDSSY